MRLKRPLKELLGRIMVELRKKDDYALFVNPGMPISLYWFLPLMETEVNLDDLPDYLDIVGGEDKMMDMGTMQSKFENGKYRNLDQLEVRRSIFPQAAYCTDSKTRPRLTCAPS